MKKYLLFVALIGLVITTLNGCSKTITVKGADGTVYESYQECCAAQDYAAAHQFLAKIQNSNSMSGEYDEAKEYVFKNEALYLMSLNDDTAKKRLVYLLKEEGGNNEHISMLIDLAIENDDESFVKILANQYTGGVSAEDLKKLMEYLSDKPTEGNMEFVKNLLKRLGEDSLLFEIALAKGDIQYIREYASKNLDLSNTELMNSLARTKDKQISEIILGLLSEEGKSIPARPALGMVQSNYDGELDDSYKTYISSVNRINRDCGFVLQIAISSKNQYLAQRAVNYAKPNISSQKVGSWRIVEKSYNGTSLKAFRVTLDNTEQQSVKAAYQEAVRSGAFR